MSLPSLRAEKEIWRIESICSKRDALLMTQRQVEFWTEHSGLCVEPVQVTILVGAAKWQRTNAAGSWQGIRQGIRVLGSAEGLQRSARSESTTRPE
jgi:hypothetical protein